jgi:membrane fusion protein (multidrug efflux system)
MTGRMAAAALALALWAGFSGCSSQGGAKDDGKKMGPPPVAVEAAAAAPAEIVEGIDVVGTLTPRFSADVKSDVSGRITEVSVAEWVRVKKGTPLARVDTRETNIAVEKARAAVESARAGLLEAEAARERADREYQRAQKLKESGLATQQSLDEARSQKEAAAARIAAASAQIRAAEEDARYARTRLEKAVIRAPFDGVVSERHVSPGEVVGEMQKVIFRIVDNRLLDLTVTVPSAEMASVRTGQPLVFAVGAFPGKSFSGRVKYINPEVSGTDRSVKVVAEVRNEPEVLKGGLFVKGRIVTEERKNVLQVPSSAIVGWDVPAKKGEVLVASDNTARRRAVRTGAVTGESVEIVSGLAKGEVVITRGGFNVREGDRVKVAAPDGGPR